MTIVRLEEWRTGHRLSAGTVAVALLLIGSPCLAQVTATPLPRESPPAPDEERATIVVTGTAASVALEKIGNTLTVVAGEAIETGRYAYLQDFLRTVPGVSVSQGGSFGSQSQVRIRGGEANHVLVLVDGIEVSAIGSGEFDFSALLAGNIERMEVLRGPQSGLYGSNALSGVVQVITKGGGGPAFDGAAEYGSFDSRFARAALTVGDRQSFFSASGLLRETDGFSSAALGTEPDGDRSATLYLRAGARLAERARLDATMRLVDKHTRTDGFDFSGGPLQGLAVDDDSFTKSRDWSGSASLTLRPDDRWETVLSARYLTRDTANGFGQSASSGDEGHRRTLAARTSFGFDTPKFADAAHSLTLFVEHEREAFRNTFPSDPSQVARQARTLIGYGAEYRLDVFDSLFLRGAMRRDENDAFADATTFSIAGSWVVDTTRLHASFGTGVTNPTFFEQFGFVPGSFAGNPDLLPEKARGFDIGIEQRLLRDRLLLDLTWFKSDLTDEIIDVFPSAANDFGKSRRQGLELSARVRAAEFDLSGSYTFLDARDPDGSAEVRRPKHQASFAVSTRFGAQRRGTLTASVTYNGERLDNDFRDYFANGFQMEKTPIAAYTLVRAAASYRITNVIELFGRIENAFDAAYQETIGYATAGRAIHGGLRVVLH